MKQIQRLTRLVLLTKIHQQNRQTANKTRKNRKLFAPKAVLSFGARTVVSLKIATVPLLSLLVSSGLVSNAQATSSLKNHPSPYIAMHAADPVNWQLWNPKTLADAKQQNKLILLSSGYFSCHWCHVMQHEVYQNPQSASLLNQDFISIKIDRELHPLVDSQMIAFAKQHRGSAGWPQHLILTPDGKPFAAFTYLPNAALQTYLRNVNKVWKTQKSVVNFLANAAMPSPNKVLETWDAAKFQHALYEQLNASIDDFSGGLKGSNKFPKTPLLLTLIQQPNLPIELADWLQLTLQQMAQQHLFDHLYGGFYRYSVDPEWQEPHFEKMLYDNAQLLELYLRADLRWPDQGFAATADATLGYLRQQLYSPNLELYLGSQSAIDAAGNEGGDYLFRADELQQLLPDTLFNLVTESWLKRPPVFALGYHPKPTSTNWTQIKQALQKQRPLPRMAIDEKALISWNALLLSAFSQAAIWQAQHPEQQAFKNLQQAPKWGAQLVAQLLEISQSATIPRSLIFKDKKRTPLLQGNLEDFAYLWHGLNAWQKISQQPLDLLPLQQKIQPLLSEQGWQDPQSLALYPLQHWVVPQDATPSISALLGCNFGAFKIDQKDFYTNPLQYADYLQLSNCESAPILLQ
ncbi:hypothetical protein THMIRHAS_01830 [Thiosulfatimonas sediminis]|uniref:Spermatogenesis-associated protein 20-like TRX domain-containing protein n=1 Tax=Thiosulfatimonas sediminis TaxID=2675054 RepID=A0A6F8PS44_9GAMM|nr:DUF255 domain-containing protein [Thiosulfatimonas sediminis]BBP44810.1 hypothetical protein THMIRHAS_01830 [Thiosulfatimonas sediminis]